MLSASLAWLDHSYPLKQVVRLLKAILSKTSLVQLFSVHQSAARGDQRRLASSWKETVNIVANLPDRIANKLKGDLDSFFFPA